MTLPAVEPVRLTIPKQDGWVVPERALMCQIPECHRQSTDGHHVVRRTATGGPVDWIAIDGFVIYNKVRVCPFCHDEINTHELWLKWDGDSGTWSVWKRSRVHEMEDVVIQHPKSLAWFVFIGSIVSGGSE